MHVVCPRAELSCQLPLGKLRVGRLVHYPVDFAPVLFGLVAVLTLPVLQPRPAFKEELGDESTGTKHEAAQHGERQWGTGAGERRHRRNTQTHTRQGALAHLPQTE